MSRRVGARLSGGIDPAGVLGRIWLRIAFLFGFAKNGNGWFSLFTVHGWGKRGVPFLPDLKKCDSPGDRRAKAKLNRNVFTTLYLTL